MNIVLKVTWTHAALAMAKREQLTIAERRAAEDRAAVQPENPTFCEGEAIVFPMDVLAVVRCRQASVVVA
jgi:hypothetical protein